MSESDPSTFSLFIDRIRAGDDLAAEELVRRYESLIRREIRVDIQDDRLNRAFDSMDVCQSVWASFFVRTRAGQYDLETPAQVAKLLLVMARNKLISKVRHEQQEKRDVRILGANASGLLESVVQPGETPSEIASGRELFELFQAGLAPDERKMMQLRQDGLSWDEIAVRHGGNAQARRMQFTRAVDRVLRGLGVHDSEENNASPDLLP